MENDKPKVEILTKPTELPSTVGGVPLQKVKATDIQNAGFIMIARGHAEKDPNFFPKVHLYLTEVIGLDPAKPINMLNVLAYVGKNWQDINLYYNKKKELEVLTAKVSKKKNGKRKK